MLRLKEPVSKKESEKDLLKIYIALLNATSARIMVIDNDFKIIFLNVSLFDYLGKLASKIREKFPDFEMSNLIGKNIDNFHLHPEYQRKLVKNLTQGHLTSISISGQVFNLRAFPLFDEIGTRIGTAAEWFDPEQMDFAGQVAAISRTQGVCEFDLKGNILKANDKFLQMYGYSSEQILGRHHSLFVDTAEAASRRYKGFWASLGTGEYASGKYIRLDSNGKKIWVQASYNPITDLKNQPFKVVEYSVEITPQVELVKTVQGLISEMTTAIAKAREESASAASSAVETLENVRSAADRAVEMNSSVRGISQSMSKSSEAVAGVTKKAAGAATSTQKLANTAGNMSGIVELIQNIAGQINLLALNATIEAARSGEAGKGFAVVASEVKSLARQAADATKLINDEIEMIQRMTAEVAQAVSEMNLEMDNIQNYVGTTAKAVEEQSATSRVMSLNMNNASSVVQSISDNVFQINEAIQKVSKAAMETEKAALSIN